MMGTGRGEVKEVRERISLTDMIGSIRLIAIVQQEQGLHKRASSGFFVIFRCEGWIASDLYSAFLQSSFLSYRSAEDAKDKYGHRYIDSAPDM